MVYKEFQGKKLSALSFGAMRLPVMLGDNSQIDIDKTREMVAYAMENGVDSVKELADYVTPGIAELIEKEMRK